MNFELTPEISLKNLSILKQKEDIIYLNKKSLEYGLFLTEKDAEMLIHTGHETILMQDRIEFGKSATIKIIEKFMKSSYISQADYAHIMATLIDIFYEAKEESLDLLTDDEVINIMYNFFEKESGGSLEVLQGRDMDYLCRQIRDTANGIINGDYLPEEDYDE